MLIRSLDPVEIRILGCLLEKQQITPDVYPLTLNALLSAANQSSNRDPVMNLSESDAQRALDRLQDDRLVWKVLGGRAVRWDHNVMQQWGLDERARAVMTLLLLRGEQTPGELRTRAERLHAFTLEEMEATLQEMAARPDPLIRELPRRPGQKEARWMHLVGTHAEPSSEAATAVMPQPDRGESFASRLERVESRVEELLSQLAELKGRLGE